MRTPATSPCIRHIIVLGLALLCAQPSVLEAQDTARPIRVGYTTFHSTRDDSNLAAIAKYLEWLQYVSEQSDTTFSRPADFQLTTGTYYQIRSWIESRHLEAAVVSPFTAYLLARSGDAVPLVELPEEAGDAPRGHRPLIRVSSRPSPDTSVDPDARYTRLLEVLLEEAVRDRQAATRPGFPAWPAGLTRTRMMRDAEANSEHVREHVDLRSLYGLDLVSHLSTSGFLFPVLRARRWLDQALDTADLGSAATRAVADEFWHLYMGSVAFRLHHDNPSGTAAEADSVISFSYSGRDEPGVDGWKTYELGGDPAAPLRIPNDVLVVRPDLLHELGLTADHDSTAACGFTDRVAPDVKAALIPSGTEMGAMFQGARYRRVQPVSEETYGAFCDHVAPLFPARGPRDPLQERFAAWYDDGQYPFTIDETIGLLQHDQEITGHAHLGLVLPGGGVKSVYQAHLLDHLYQGCYLANENVKDSVCAKTGSRAPLAVKNIVGTSGGAMVGLLTALTGPEHDDSIQVIVRQATSIAVFPGLDVLRWISVCATILVLVTLIGLARVGERGPFADGVPSPEAPARMALPLLLALIALGTAILINQSGGIYLEYVFILEGVLFAVLVLLAHFVLSCTHRVEDGDYQRFANETRKAARKVTALLTTTLALAGFAIPATGTWALILWIGSALAAVALLIVAVRSGFIAAVRGHAGVAWRRTAGAWVNVFWILLGALALAGVALVLDGPLPWPGAPAGRGVMPAVFAASAGLMVMAALLYAIRSRAFGLELRGVRDYGWALGLAFVYVLAAHGAIWVGQLLSDGSHVTTLELTKEYWVWLIPIAAALATLWLLVGAREGGPVRTAAYRSARFFGVPDRNALIMGSPGTRLAGVAVLGMLCWIGIVAPAMYGNADAIDIYCNAVVTASEPHGTSADLCESLLRRADEAGPPGPADSTIELHTNLVVTGVLLERFGRERDAGADSLPLGDHYFCFGAARSGCEQAHGADERWHIMRQYSDADVVHTAFASGSPFPVFPSHEVKTDAGSIQLMDGGYAHNVPVEAARLTEARQVLIVHTTPERPDDGTAGEWVFLSPLIRYSGRIVPFLFDRAQALDRSIADDMVVASLTPRYDPERPFPFLTDFRNDVIRTLAHRASTDLADNHRIGTVQGWGLPNMRDPRRIAP